MAYRELTDQFEYTEDEKGITATRFFLWSTTDVASNETLPVIGEVFALDISALTTTIPVDLFCRNRSFKYVAGDKSTWIVSCSYSNEPVDTTGYGDEGPVMGVESLPQNVEYAGEFQIFEPPTDLATQAWTWTTDTAKVEVPIYFKVKTSNIRISRILTSDKFEPFKLAANGIIGKVNDADFQGMGVGCVLFTGYTTERYNNHKDALAWRVELTFSFRDPDDTNLDGYQKILRKTGIWDKPTKNSLFMYKVTSFDPLFD